MHAGVANFIFARMYYGAVSLQHFDMTTLSLEIDPELSFLLRKKWRNSGMIAYPLTRRASIKDILEAIGIPHTEIGRLSTAKAEIDFAYIPLSGDRITVNGIPIPFSVWLPSRLRPQTFGHLRFLADINVGKLAPLLRLAGFDTLYGGNLPDRELASLAAREERILLTRDRLLLCRNEVHFGRLIRRSDAYEQLAEVIEVFGLQRDAKPFSRCMKCNMVLKEVSKQSVYPRLLPLTRLYYQHFRQCPNCNSVYWKGSHRESMENSLRRVGLHWLLDDAADRQGRKY